MKASKTPKNYRLSPITCRELDRLKELEPGATETELVERAITLLLLSYGSKDNQTAKAGD